KYLAGIRFVDTAKYQGSKPLGPSLCSFHMPSDSNFLDSLFRVGREKPNVTLTTNYIQFLIFN
ncbi:MAG TPA: hypothetical protein VEL11_07895, partial [Candidatus Bathyarchaeia archaeon]|nr:hypothetical protein [Candidatus Bathyarchaeia archaeon]